MAVASMARAQPLHADASQPFHAAVIADRRSCEIDPFFRSARFSTPSGYPLGDEALLTCMVAAAKKVAAFAAKDGTAGDVDLHGLTVSEAVVVMTELWRDCGLGRQSGYGGEVLIITGAGHHSGSRGPRLRPAVQRLLDDWDADYDEEEGAFLVACAGPRKKVRRTGMPMVMVSAKPSTGTTETFTCTASMAGARVTRAEDPPRCVRVTTRAGPTGSSADQAAAALADAAVAVAPFSCSVAAGASGAPPCPGLPAGTASHPTMAVSSETAEMREPYDGEWVALAAHPAATAAADTPVARVQRAPLAGPPRRPLFSSDAAPAAGGHGDRDSLPEPPPPAAAAAVGGNGGGGAAGGLDEGLGWALAIALTWVVLATGHWGWWLWSVFLWVLVWGLSEE